MYISRLIPYPSIFSWLAFALGSFASASASVCWNHELAAQQFLATRKPLPESGNEDSLVVQLVALTSLCGTPACLLFTSSLDAANRRYKRLMPAKLCSVMLTLANVCLWSPMCSDTEIQIAAKMT